jgi:hypothetical protein
MALSTIHPGSLKHRSVAGVAMTLAECGADDQGRLGLGLAIEQGRKQFFFEKKNQKTFASWLARPERSVRIPKSKSFLVLFFKKELLPSCCPSFLCPSRHAL